MGYSLSFCTYVTPTLFVWLPDGVFFILLYLFYGVPCLVCVTSPIHTDGVALRPNAQRLLSAAPLATSTDRHERRCATKPKDRDQLRGRASGVRCKAMLGREFGYHRAIMYHPKIVEKITRATISANGIAKAMPIVFEISVNHSWME